MSAKEKAGDSGPYKVVIFDVNGTLLGHNDPLGFEKRFAGACRDLRHAVTTTQVCRVFRHLLREPAARKTPRLRRASSGDQYRQTMTKIYRLMLKTLEVPGDPGQQADALYERLILQEGFMPLFSDVKDALSRLRSRGIRLGILSNFPPHLEETLQLHGIHDYLDFFVVSSVVGMEKPEPAVFELAPVSHPDRPARSSARCRLYPHPEPFRAGHARRGAKSEVEPEWLD